MTFHVIQSKLLPIEKKVPLLPLVFRVFQGDNIPHPIPDHMLMAFIPIGFDEDFRIYLPVDAVKSDRACILGACLLYFSLLLEGMFRSLTIFNITLKFLSYLLY